MALILSLENHHTVTVTVYEMMKYNVEKHTGNMTFLVSFMCMEGHITSVWIDEGTSAAILLP